MAAIMAVACFLRDPNRDITADLDTGLHRQMGGQPQ